MVAPKTYQEVPKRIAPIFKFSAPAFNGIISPSKSSKTVILTYLELDFIANLLSL
jgi:hypothetical protein